jgi:putative transposase
MIFVRRRLAAGYHPRMPRVARGPIGGIPVHVVTRGNARQRVFFDAEDCRGFLALIDEAQERLSVPVLAYCLMPNHVHLVVRPRGERDLGRWMHWLLTAHVRRHHRRYGTIGRVWQDRYKAFPIEEDRHLITVIRYVERNPVAARLVERAEHWPWSSLRERIGRARDARISVPPLPLGAGWLDSVNEPLTAAELAKLRQSIERGRPFGSDAWTVATAAAYGLESTLRGRGRPAAHP